MITKKPKNKKRVRANQYTVDPRQALFLGFYLDRENKETFSNGYQAAIEAGYSEEYAKVMKSNMPDWLSESIKNANMIQKAERNVNEFLDLDCVNTGVTKKGDEFTFTDPRLMRIKSENSHFILERLNRAKFGRSDLPEQTKPPVQVNIFVNQKVQTIISKAEDDLRKAIEGEIKKDE